MPQTRELLDALALSLRPEVSSDSLAAAVDAMLECEEAVTLCATGMVAEDDVSRMRDAIHHDMNCADILGVTRRLLTRGSTSVLLATQLEACVMACERSIELCGVHASHHEHCRMCVEANGRCAAACRRVLQELHGLTTPA
jgi:hypothetical protein